MGRDIAGDDTCSEYYISVDPSKEKDISLQDRMKNLGSLRNIEIQQFIKYIPIPNDIGAIIFLPG